MYKQIKVQRFSSGSVFKMLLIGIGSIVIPFSLLMGCLALFGAETVHWNQRTVTGIAGLLVSPLIGLGLTLLSTLFLGIGLAIGLHVYSFFRPLNIWVRVEEEASAAGASSTH